ncbi:ATPase [Clostridium luticellarii]|jgi:hypothetical protein|uniref:ATPase n=1 Tax=Clostridium luticellarii TaxID=1691940 RepID=UPI0023565EF3|nr:ATPase [Clostridium luticellarii]MCI1945453.1 ATPase [Clostridium luticellarii]MCI1968786.1 ATPase [Clostridium luticellarii]
MNDKIKHFFTSGNTSKDLNLFLDFITNQETLNKKFLLKSKSLFLKSSLIENIGEQFRKNGYEVEYYHCAYDKNLLDGIIIKKLNIALLNNSLLNDTDSYTGYEVLDLEENLSKDNLKKYTEMQNDTETEIRSALDRFYRFIEAARLMQEDWGYCNKLAVDYSKLTAVIQDLKSKIFTAHPHKTPGKSRHLFATALTQNGIVSFIDTLCSSLKKVYVLNGDPGTGKNMVLKSIYREALKKGLYVEVYHHPLIEDKLEHIIIPELNTALITSNEINKSQFNGMQIYMNNLIDYSKINKSDVEKDKTNFYFFLNKSLSIIGTNKNLQNNLEKYYFKNIDSEALSITCRKFLAELKECERQKP